MIYIAIGANLPDAQGRSPLASCWAAAAALALLPGLRVVACSRWYASAAIPAGDQPEYINGVVALRGSADPAWLLAALQAMEVAAGRVRGERNAARVIDLDIVDMDGRVRAAPDPVLPHPRAHLRGFVLLPLRDVAPEWVHPERGEGIDALIAALPAQIVTLVE